MMIVPSGAVFVGASVGALSGFRMLGGFGIAAIRAARGCGGAVPFGALALATTLGTGGVDARIDGVGGGGTLRKRGGLALGSAATFFGGAGVTIFGGAGAFTFGGVGALIFGGGGFMASMGALSGTGFGFASAGGGAIFGGTGFWGAAVIGMAPGGVAATLGLGLAATLGSGVAATLGLGVATTFGAGAGGRARAVAGFGGCALGSNPGGRLKVDRGGVAGGGNSAKPGLRSGAGRAVRNIPGSVGSGPSLSRTLRSTMTLGRLEPGE